MDEREERAAPVRDAEMNDGDGRSRSSGTRSLLAQAGPAIRTAGEDPSQRLIDSTLKRNPDPAGSNNGWNYQTCLFLFGQYLLYRRTRHHRLLTTLSAYVQAHVDERGRPDTPIESLDSVLAANLLIVLYQETREERYKLGAATSGGASTHIRARRTVASDMGIVPSARGNSGWTVPTWRYSSS